MKCTEYSLDEGGTDENDHHYPCHCPTCGGFLKWNRDWKTGELTPICNKCKTELIILPYTEGGIEYEWGKICPISLPQSFRDKGENS